MVVREMGGGFRMEGTGVYLWLIYIDVWQNQWQYCNYLSLKVRNNLRKIKRTHLSMQETQVPSLGQEDPLEKEMATHFSILAWEIPMN